MNVIGLREMKLVGLRVVCSGDEYVNEIPKAYSKLQERLFEIKDVINPAKMVGAYVVGNYSDEEDGYWVCVEVATYDEIPKGMVTLTVPPQRYAVITHNGPNYLIRNTYEILHKWIEDNGFERILRSWHLEISDEHGLSGTNDLTVVLHDTIK